MTEARGSQAALGKSPAGLGFEGKKPPEGSAILVLEDT